VRMTSLSAWLFSFAILKHALTVTPLVEKSALEDLTLQDTAPRIIALTMLISLSSLQTTTTTLVILLTSAFATSIEALFVTTLATARVTAPIIWERILKEIATAGMDTTMSNIDATPPLAAVNQMKLLILMVTPATADMEDTTITDTIRSITETITDTTETITLTIAFATTILMAYVDQAMVRLLIHQGRVHAQLI